MNIHKTKDKYTYNFIKGQYRYGVSVEHPDESNITTWGRGNIASKIKIKIMNQNNFDLRILQLLETLKTVISRNRDLLSVDDVQLLELCARELKTHLGLAKKQSKIETISIMLQICLNLLRFFDIDIF